MALSPNYGWAEPDNSSLVKNGAQDIRALGDAIDTSVWNVGYGQAGKNKIMNADFGIWQRGTSFSNPSTTFIADRWLASITGGSGGTASRQTFTPATAPVAPYESAYYLRMASNAGATYLELTQKVEDVRSLAGQSVTISFWAKASSSITFTPLLRQNFGSGGSASVDTTGTVQAIASSSWTRYIVSVTVPSLSGKTIGTSSFLQFTLYSSAGTTASNTVEFWGLQLETGSKATPFQTASGNSISGELAMCRRYIYNPFYEESGANKAIATANAISTTQAHPAVILPNMRIAPSQTSTASDFALGYTGGAALTALAVQVATPNFWLGLATVASGLTANAGYNLYRPGTTSNIIFSAEL
jgi:hypothetical protein